MSSQFEAESEQFCEYLTKQRSAPRTVAEYRRVLQFLHREQDLFSATPEYWLAWRNARDEAVRTKQIGPAKPRAELQIVRQFYQWRYDTGRASTVPVLGLKPFKRPKWKPRPMPRDDVERLMQAVWPDKTNPLSLGPFLQARAIVGLLYNGLRNSEACTALTDQFSYSRNDGTLIVRVHGKGQSLAGPKVEEVPLQVKVAAFLAEHMLYRFSFDQYRDLKQGPVAPQDLFGVFDRTFRRFAKPEPVFLTPTGQPMHKRELNRQFAEWRERAELGYYVNAQGTTRPFGPHSLRHSFGTFLIEADVDAFVVQNLMRHSSIATTQMYIQVGKSKQARAVQALPSF